MISTIILLVITLITVIVILLLNKKGNENVNTKFSQILAVAYFGLFFVGLILPDAFIKSVGDNIFELNTLSKPHAILRIFNACTPIILIIATFFKNRLFKNLAVYICLPVTIISIFSYNTYMLYYLDPQGRGINMIYWLNQGVKDVSLNQVFRTIWLSLEWLIAFIITLKIYIVDKHRFCVKNAKEWIYLLVTLILLMIQNMPIYVPQILFGYSNIIFDGFSVSHIIWILYLPIKVVVLTLLFKKKSDQTKLALCFVLALSLIIQYNSMFALTINIKRLPLQLCNLASYLIIIALITKNKHIFNFNFLINAVGATLALAVPDVNGTGIFEVWNMHFIYEHTNVMVVPILCLTLGIFPKMDKRSLLDAFIGFSVYFIICLILNTVLNGIAIQTGNNYFEVNYLFMYNKKVIIDLIPAFEIFTRVELGSDIYKMMPHLSLFVYVGYTALYVALYFGLRLKDVIKDKVKEKRALQEELASGL